MKIFVRAANQFSPLFKEKNYMFVSKKMEILQENTKMMNRYCFSLNNIEIKPSFYHLAILIKNLYYLNCLRLYNKQNVTRYTEHILFSPLEGVIFKGSP